VTEPLALLEAARAVQRQALVDWEAAKAAEEAVLQSAVAEHSSAPHGYWKARYAAALRLAAATSVLSALHDIM
jgi:hypothetical protein